MFAKYLLFAQLFLCLRVGSVWRSETSGSRLMTILTILTIFWLSEVGELEFNTQSLIREARRNHLEAWWIKEPQKQTDESLYKIEACSMGGAGVHMCIPYTHTHTELYMHICISLFSIYKRNSGRPLNQAFPFIFITVATFYTKDWSKRQIRYISYWRFSIAKHHQQLRLSCSYSGGSDMFKAKLRL